MKILLARYAGFCMGVKRAMEIVLEKMPDDGTPVFTFGPLIHNPQTLALLRKKNVRILENPSDCCGGTVVIRAHGITPEKLARLREAGAEIRDATCPRVMRVQRIVQKAGERGDTVIIVGDRGHAEVEGLKGYAGRDCIVVENEAEIDSLPRFGRITVVAQTTMDERRFQAVCEKLRARAEAAEIHDTICDSTRRRLQEMTELADRVDAFIIVGGKSSANTTRLASVAAWQGKPAFHIETEDELDGIDFSPLGSVAVTAGASTPNWMINRVLDRLYEIRRTKTHGFPWLLQWLFHFIVRSNLYVAVGSGLFSLASAILMGLSPRPLFFVVTASYVFSMHILNHFTDIRAMEINEPARLVFYRKHRRLLITGAVLASLASLAGAAFLGFLPFLILLVATSLGVAYSVRLLPRAKRGAIKFSRLKDIPGSKEVLVALAWATVISLVPFAASPRLITLVSVAAVFLFTGTLVFIRSVSYSLKDIQGDRILGNETIPVILGERRARLLCVFLGAFLVVLLTTSYLFRWTSGLALFLLPLVPYALYYLNRSSRLVGKSIVADILIDTQFYIAGLLVLGFLAY
jgi:(E)-4-hydroxy-3-methyl-but-2-enyl pyrophosphate reductase